MAPSPELRQDMYCSYCIQQFVPNIRLPITIECGHVLCRNCILEKRLIKCPFDNTYFKVPPDKLIDKQQQPRLMTLSQALPSTTDFVDAPIPHHEHLNNIMQKLNYHLRYNNNNNYGNGPLSRPLQRKLMTLSQCPVSAEGLVKMRRATLSLAERVITELIMRYQSPQTVSATLWSAVRARGCQFLGPVMQEEVLKLILLALEDGTALSRKVLVMFVRQRLLPTFPHASKTSVGNVVQLLYRASCFTVIKQDKDSSLLSLKEQYRYYLPLRREHDTQIVQVALDCGLRIVPDQWSALLYGDINHRSYMQSIIDKLQNPQSISSSVNDLMQVVRRKCNDRIITFIEKELEVVMGLSNAEDADLWHSLPPVLESINLLMEFLQGVNPFKDDHQSATRPLSESNANANQEETKQQNERMINDERVRCSGADSNLLHSPWSVTVPPRLPPHPDLTAHMLLDPSLMANLSITENDNSRLLAQDVTANGSNLRDANLIAEQNEREWAPYVLF